MQAGQVNEMSDLMFCNGVLQFRQVGDIPWNKTHFADLIFFKNEPQAPRVFLEIVNPDLVSLEEEIARNPATDATVTAGEKNTHGERPSAGVAGCTCTL